MTETIIKVRLFEWGYLQNLADFIASHLRESVIPFSAGSTAKLEANLKMGGRRPTKNLLLAFLQDDVLGGFAFVEPESKIGRSIIDVECAEIPQESEVTGALLEAGLKRAREQGNPLVHIGVVSNTKHVLREKVSNMGFYHVRSYWQMVRRDGETAPIAEGNPDRSTAIIIREMSGIEEVPELTALQNMAFRSSFGFSPNTVEENKAKLLIPDTVQKVLFAESKGRLLGYCWLSVKNAEPKRQRQGRVEMIGVRFNTREKGIGRRLLMSGLRELAEAGSTEVGLDVDATNANAVHLYKKLGFKKTGSIDWLELPIH